MWAVLFVAPLLLGGRHPVGRFALAGIVWTTAVSWGLAECLNSRRRWSWSGGETVIVLATALLLLQLSPLPPFVLDRLSPSLRELLPLWSASSAPDVSLGDWRQVSLTPSATREGLCMLLVYGVLFVATYQRLQHSSDVKRMLRWIASAAIFMAAVGLIQYLAGNGRFLWVYDHPSRDAAGAVKGPFINQNHFAGYLALGLGPLLWWLHDHLTRRTGSRHQRSSAPQRVPTGPSWIPVGLTGGLALVLVSILLSFSRGGMLAITCGALIGLTIMARKRLIDKRTVLVLTASLVIVGIAVGIHGRQRLASRLATLTAGSLEQVDRSSGRRNVWSAVLNAVPDFAILGAGVGSHREVYPRYFPQPSEVEYTHAENGYLQVLLETGVCGLLLLLGGCILAGLWFIRALRHTSNASCAACIAALAVGVVASLVHSLVDFVWYIPACMSLVVIQVAAVARLSTAWSHPASPTAAPGRSTMNPTTSQIGPVGIFTLLVAGLGLGWFQTLAGPACAARYWDDYLAMSLASEIPGQESVRVGRQRRWDDVDLSDTETLDAMAAHLQNVLRRNPSDARANLRYATVNLRRFELAQKTAENAMSLLDVRQAAQASSFPSKETQDIWLDAALGKHREYLDQALRAATRAVHLCPLQGQAYLHLAELAFLHHRDLRLQHALLDQALRVRPYDGMVLFSLGREAVLEGQWERGLTYWREAFDTAPEMQDEIIAAIAPQLNPEVFLAIFRPDRHGLGKLFNYYRQTGQDASARQVGQPYARSLEQHVVHLQGVEAARYWNVIQEIYAFLDSLTEATRAARHAVNAQPGDYRLRSTLGVRLQQTEQWTEALEQFRWCQNRRPEDPRMERKILEVTRQIRDQEAASTARRAPAVRAER